jgi:hypothetical protein
MPVDELQGSTSCRDFNKQRYSTRRILQLNDIAEIGNYQ